MEILERGFFYHIYNRGNNREKLFRDHEDYTYFLNLFL
jgi:putative transposase